MQTAILANSYFAYPGYAYYYPVYCRICFLPS